MSTRHNNGSHYENHQRAAELQDLSAHAHIAASVHNGRQEHESGEEQSRRAREHSGKNYPGMPIDSHPNFTHQETAELANQLWQARGCPEGSPDEDWFHATEQLRTRHFQGER